MISARAQCPECLGPCVVDLSDLLYSPTMDYFRCRACGCWWVVPKGTDDPEARIMYGNANSLVSSKGVD